MSCLGCRYKLRQKMFPNSTELLGAVRAARGASRTLHPIKRDTGEENPFNSLEIRNYSLLQLLQHKSASPACTLHSREGSSALSKFQPAPVSKTRRPQSKSPSEGAAVKHPLPPGQGQLCFQQKS